ncbi:hypothetical protein DMENIID0001_008910 [Sergentomyia squamirostris]
MPNPSESEIREVILGGARGDPRASSSRSGENGDGSSRNVENDGVTRWKMSSNDVKLAIPKFHSGSHATISSTRWILIIERLADEQNWSTATGLSAQRILVGSDSWSFGMLGGPLCWSGGSSLTGFEAINGFSNTDGCWMKELFMVAWLRIRVDYYITRDSRI